MAAKSNIEWTDSSWPVVTGCEHVSPACDFCYAARDTSDRLRHHPAYQGLAFGGRFTGQVRLQPDRMGWPLRWRKPRRIFVCSTSDLFHKGVPDGFIAWVWYVMAQCPQHTFQILTKRPGRMRSWVRRWADTAADRDVDSAGALPPMPRGPEAVRATYTSGRAGLFAGMLDQMGTPPPGAAYPLYDWMEGPRWWPAVLPNVWLGVSVENQRYARVRIPLLWGTPAAVRWISAEPLLGPVDLGDVRGVNALRQGTGSLHPPLDWVVAGGETDGPFRRRARPSHPDWFRSLRDQCTDAGVPFFFKQWGDWMPLGPLYEQNTEQGDDDAEDAVLEAAHLEVTGHDVAQLETGGYVAQGHQPTDPRTWLMARVGKKTAGEQLDGRPWKQMPLWVGSDA